jgi:hypothetical protein
MRTKTNVFKWFDQIFSNFNFTNDKFKVAIKENRFDLVKNYTTLNFKRNEVLRLQMILIYFYVYIFIIEFVRKNLRLYGLYGDFN